MGAKGVEKIEEALVGGLVGEEAELAALTHVGDDFNGPAKVSVGVPGGCKDGEIGFGEIVFLSDRVPDGCGVGELLLERRDCAIEGCGLDAEPVSDARPHPTPAEDVAVDDVEGLVASYGRCGCPLEMTREKTGVGHVGEAVPLSG